MELLQTEKFYIFNKGQESLWFDRLSGACHAKTCWDLPSSGNPICLGIVHAIVGKLQIHPDLPPRLVLVTDVRRVGSIGGADGSPKIVYCITRVAFLPLTIPLDTELNLQPCQKHINHPNNGSEKRNMLPFGDLQQKVALSKTFGTIKNVTSTIKSATVNVAATATGQNKGRRDVRDRDRYERRILDELLKMFNESDSFYFSYDTDLTSSLQRQSHPSYKKDAALWRRADDCFFWNKYMIEDLAIEQASAADEWVVPIIQGFVQIEVVNLTEEEPKIANVGVTPSAVPGNTCTLVLISRRSRFRAGTRYKRRGVDEDGHVANYVETEQIVSLLTHRVAFIQVRGSVPIFWSQPGFKYRPPPRLDKGPEETAVAFKKHFEDELVRHSSIVCVSLVEQGGKEKVIADSYLEHVLNLNYPTVTYVSFDFHEYCRGMRYENVSVLIEALVDVISAMRYCWVDKEGVICTQNGVFRINCIDCLDRTNVVQTAIARSVMESQFVKLGVISPEHPLPASCRVMLQTMWANNGDTISKQYAGTSALKGDFTRTGERKFTGLMKDGMNSANRYYLNRFKDAYRQATIDHMLGNPVSEDMISFNPEFATEEEEASVAQHVKHVIDDSKKVLVPDAETILGAWGLIDADPASGDPDQTDMDIILVLTKDSYYVAQYEEAADRILRYQRVSLIDLDSIEVGPYTFQGMFKTARNQHCLRLNYQSEGQHGYYHMFRSMNIRFFNTMAVTIKTEEELTESMKSIADTFEGAVQMIGCEAKLIPGRLEKRKNRGSSNAANPLNLLNPLTSFTKTSPESFKNVGTRAFSNVTSGLAKLNPISSLRQRQNNKDEERRPSSSALLQAPAVYLNQRRQSEHMFLTSCGILNSLVKLHPTVPSIPSPPIQRCYSDTMLYRSKSGSNSSKSRSPTPEILVSGTKTVGSSVGPSTSPPFLSIPGQLAAPLSDSRIRKLSHSSDEVDSRDSRMDDSSVHRASSTSNLGPQLHLPLSHSDGTIIASASAKDSTNPTENSALSPLSAFNKEAVLAPFSVLAKGMQSLAPGAGKFARGMQNIGVNLDPRRLKTLRQKNFEEDVELEEKIKKCNSKIIRL